MSLMYKYILGPKCGHIESGFGHIEKNTYDQVSPFIPMLGHIDHRGHMYFLLSKKYKQLKKNIYPVYFLRVMT